MSRPAAGGLRELVRRIVQRDVLRASAAKSMYALSGFLGGVAALSTAALGAAAGARATFFTALTALFMKFMLKHRSACEFLPSAENFVS